MNYRLKTFAPSLTALVLVLATALAPAWAQADTASKQCFNGYAYNDGGDTLLYTEHHEQTVKNGRPLQWDVVYRAVDAAAMGTDKGAIIARKSFDFSDNPTVPVYTLDLTANGYREGIRHDDKGWRMIKRASKDAPTESERFEYEPPMAADSGFDPFVKENFQALMEGETVKFDFVAAGRLDVIGLRAYKLEETEMDGHPAVKFQAELNSLLRFVVDSLVMTYDIDGRKLLQYRGVSNLHNAQGDTFPVVIKYLDEAPAGANGSNTPTGCSGS